jgi:hypothetical protein
MVKRGRESPDPVSDDGSSAQRFPVRNISFFTHEPRPLAGIGDGTQTDKIRLHSTHAEIFFTFSRECLFSAIAELSMDAFF